MHSLRSLLQNGLEKVLGSMLLFCTKDRGSECDFSYIDLSQEQYQEGSCDFSSSSYSFPPPDWQV